MADPVTMYMGATMAGAGVSAFGSIFGGDAKAQAYSYQAGIARMNERVAKQNADWARATGEVQAQESGMRTREQVGQTLAIQGASNLDVARGSGTAVRASEIALGQFDQALIRSNAARRAYGYEVEAASKEAEARMDEMAASTSREAGFIGAVSSILGGATSVSSQFMRGRQVGLV